MPKSVALITIHGMGEQPPDYYVDFSERLKRELGPAAWDKLSLQPVYFQDILQKNEDAVWQRSRNQVGWQDLRKFLLFGFSDAASLEHHQNAPGSPYLTTQQRIMAALDTAFGEAGGTAVPVILFAQSLGCQVMSSYIWDAQDASPFAGVFKGGGPTDAPKGSPKDKFRRLTTAKRFYTTGCNIPIFLSGHAKIEPIARPHPDFKWINLFDKDDALGWPLGPLSVPYGQLVTDTPIKVGRSLLDRLLKAWNPIAHTLYWKDPAVVRHVADGIRAVAP